MLDFPLTWTSFHEELQHDLLERLELAWDTGGVGGVPVGEAYVQWAKFEPGLQIECVSNAFLDESDQLTFIQRRRLAQLGFERPRPPDSPNYFMRFLSRDTLTSAAEILSVVLLDVLSPFESRPSTPSPGRVWAVVPIGKTSFTALTDVVQHCVDALLPKRELVVLDAFSYYGLGAETFQVSGAHVVDGAALHGTGAARGYGQDDVITFLRQAVAEGWDVVVAGPRYLPGYTADYDAALAELATGVMALGDETDFGMFWGEPAPFDAWRDKAACIFWGRDPDDGPAVAFGRRVRYQIVNANTYELDRGAFSLIEKFLGDRSGDTPVGSGAVVHEPAVTSDDRAQDQLLAHVCMARDIGAASREECPSIVPGHVGPVAWFGDSRGYADSSLRVVTAGLNPSDAEFPIQDPGKRLPLGQTDLEHKSAYDNYFRRAPYRQWFNAYELLLAGMDVSYYDGAANTALHTDIATPVPTSPTWSKLSRVDRRRLLAAAAGAWQGLLGTLDPHVVIASVAYRHFDAMPFDWVGDWQVLHTIDRTNPYVVEGRRFALASGGSTWLVRGRAAQLPFGNVKGRDRYLIGSVLKGLS